MEGNSPYITNLVNSIIGVSVLAMPFCFKQCGIILGLGLLFCAAWLTYLSCSMLASSAFHKRRRTYEYLALSTLGPTGKFAVELSMIGLMLGTCVAFYVVIGDLSNGILTKFIDGADPKMLRTFTIIFCALCIALPLGMMKNLSVLSYFGFCSLLFYLAFLVVVILNAVSSGLLTWEWWGEVILFRPAGIFQCLPIFSLAYACQCQLFIVYSSLEDPSVRRIEDIVSSAIKFVTVMYMSVGFFGYTTYREHIAGNLLVSFPSNHLLDFIKLGFAMSVVLGFPLMIFPCRQSIHTLFFGKPAGEGLQPNTYIPPLLFKTITLAIVLSTMTIAIVIPNVETILGLTGATMGSMICFIFPALIYDKASPKGSGYIPKFVFALGCLLLVVCTYSNLANTGQTTEIIEPPLAPINPGVPDFELPGNTKNEVNVDSDKVEENKKEEPDITQDKDKPKVVAEVIDDEHRHEPANPIDPAVDKDADQVGKPDDAANAPDGNENPEVPKDQKEDPSKSDDNPPASNEEKKDPQGQKNEDAQPQGQNPVPPQKEEVHTGERNSPKEVEDKKESVHPADRIPGNINQPKIPSKEDPQNPPPNDQDHHPPVGRLSPKVIKQDEGHQKQEIPRQPGKADGDGEGGIQPDKVPSNVDGAMKQDDSPPEKQLLEKIKIQHGKQQQLLEEQEQLIKKLEEHQDKKEQAGEENPEARAPDENAEEPIRHQVERAADPVLGNIVKDHFFVEAPVAPKDGIIGGALDPKVDLLKQGIVAEDKVLPGRELLSEENRGVVAQMPQNVAQMPQNVAPVPQNGVDVPKEPPVMPQNSVMPQENFEKGKEESPQERKARALEDEEVKEMEKESEEDDQENIPAPENQEKIKNFQENVDTLSFDSVENSKEEIAEEGTYGQQNPREDSQPDTNATSKLNGNGEKNPEKECSETDTDCWQAKLKSRELKSVEQNESNDL